MGGSKPRALLAVLLLSANEVVSREADRRAQHGRLPASRRRRRSRQHDRRHRPRRARLASIHARAAEPARRADPGRGTRRLPVRAPPLRGPTRRRGRSRRLGPPGARRRQHERNRGRVLPRGTGADPLRPLVGHRVPAAALATPGFRPSRHGRGSGAMRRPPQPPTGRQVHTALWRHDRRPPGEWERSSRRGARWGNTSRSTMCFFSTILTRSPSAGMAARRSNSG